MCAVFYFLQVFWFLGVVFVLWWWPIVFGCWGFVVDWKSAAVERGRLAEIAKIDLEINRLYHRVEELWVQRELIELSLRGDV